MFRDLKIPVMTAGETFCVLSNAHGRGTQFVAWSDFRNKITQVANIKPPVPDSQDSAAGCGGTPPICRQAQTKLEVALYMFLWSPDTEAVLVAMSCFRHLCEEADIRCGVDEVSVHNFLPNYNTFMEFASVSNMMSTGKCG